MTQIIERSYEAEVDSILEGERAVVARINTAGVDRLRTVIDPLGCDVSHFNKTRSVLWQHGQDPVRRDIPIGSGWVKVRRSERDMLGKTTFAKDEFSEQLFQAYKEGTLRGWSIRAGVQEASPPTKQEIRSQPALEDCEMIYRKWDLLEYSGTPTPGNSDCLTMLVSRGLITAPDGFVPAEPAIEPEPEPTKPALPHVSSDGSHWYVRGLGIDATQFVSSVDAEQVFSMLNQKPISVERFHFDLITQTRSINDQFKRDIEAILDLRLRGRV